MTYEFFPILHIRRKEKRGFQISFWEQMLFEHMSYRNSVVCALQRQRQNYFVKKKGLQCNNRYTFDNFLLNLTTFVEKYKFALFSKFLCLNIRFVSQSSYNRSRFQGKNIKRVHSTFLFHKITNNYRSMNRFHLIYKFQVEHMSFFASNF